jgi:hypothetical protein
MADPPPAEVMGMLVAAISHLTSVVNSLVPRVGAIETAVFGAPAQKFQIYVKTFNGKHITIEATSGLLIEDLRGLIHQKEEIPPDLQRLICHGVEMKDGDTIGDYDIRPEATVQLVLRLRG